MKYFSILFFIVTGFVLSRVNDHYRGWMILIFSALFAVYLYRESREQKPAPLPRLDTWLSVGTLIFLARLADKPLMVYVNSEAVVRSVQGLVWVAVAGLALRNWPWRKKTAESGFAVALGALIAVRIITVVKSPEAFIDVFVVTRLAVNFFLQGRNPYGQVYPDIYLTAEGHSPYAPAFNYPPGILFWDAPFEFLLHDIRFAYLAADLLTAGGIYLLCRRLNYVRETSQSFALLWLAFPTALFTLSKAWIDVVLTMTITAGVLAALFRRWLLAGALLGFLLTVKQYSVVVAAVAGPWAFRKLPARESRRFFVATLGIATAIFLTFIGGDFIHSVVTSLLGQAVRYDSFSLVAWFHNELGWKLPGAVGLGLSVAMFAWFAFRFFTRPTMDPREGFFAVTALYGVIFLFGKQAFVNYYQLFSFLLLLHIIFSNRRK